MSDALTLEPEYVTPQQAAKLFGLSVKTLESMRSRRIGPPFYKIGASVRYRVAELRKWLEAHRVPTQGGEQ